MVATSKPIPGLDDAFGARAADLRSMQNCLLNLYAKADYQEVIPPMLERPDSLASGAGKFLSDQTLVFSDPAEAGLLAIRPDITPQIARIAATRLQHENQLRLCYSGSVLLARPDSLSGSRQQWQTGLECLGLSGAEGDVEVMHLAAASLHAAGFESPLLQVGHTGLLRALTHKSAAPLDAWAELLLRRSPEDMHSFMRDQEISADQRDALLHMASGEMDADWLAEHASSLGASFASASDELIQLVDQVSEKLSGEVNVCIDAAVMPRFLYHSGIVFSGFAQGSAQALLHGGRYDEMMAAHGRDMPATGFSFDLWSWLDAV